MHANLDCCNETVLPTNTYVNKWEFSYDDTQPYVHTYIQCSESCCYAHNKTTSIQYNVRMCVPMQYHHCVATYVRTYVPGGGGCEEGWPHNLIIHHYRALVQKGEENLQQHTRNGDWLFTQPEVLHTCTVGATLPTHHWVHTESCL